jgi:hypothetical protein
MGQTGQSQRKRIDAHLSGTRQGNPVVEGEWNVGWTLIAHHSARHQEMDGRGEGFGIRGMHGS